jgi:hypothetical protein
LTDTLTERVEKLIQPDPTGQWGDALLSTTPTSVAVQELAVRLHALEDAVREIAREVQGLSESAG